MTNLNCRAGSDDELGVCRGAQAEPWGPNHRATHLHRDVHEAKLAVEVRRGTEKQAHDG